MAHRHNPEGPARTKKTKDPAAAPPQKAPAGLEPASLREAVRDVHDEPTVDLSSVLDGVTNRPSGQLPMGSVVVEDTAECVIVFASGIQDEKARELRERLVLEPGARVRVKYLREAEDVSGPGVIKRIDMGHRFCDGEPLYSPIVDGQRTPQGGLVRRSPVFSVTEDGCRQLEVWFRVEMEDGRVVWDSQFGSNYQFPIQ
jgi:hypothetical protein